jgi:hypothetical protein
MTFTGTVNKRNFFVLYLLSICIIISRRCSSFLFVAKSIYPDIIAFCKLFWFSQSRLTGSKSLLKLIKGAEYGINSTGIFIEF